jgi:4-hydroxy-tetrahydrodipicolinate reductase
MADLKIGVVGAAGRMGAALVRMVYETPGCVVAGGIERPGSEAIGKDLGDVAGIGSIGLEISNNALELFVGVDAVLDFTTPDASVEFAAIAAQARIVHVIGTTGFVEVHEEKIRAAARHARIIKSGNMSVGVNLLAALVTKVAGILDDDFDIEVLEMHHRHKVDAPSGTALLLGEAAAKGRGVDIAQKSVRSRDGITGARKSGDIGFATLRGGSVIGEHSVIFAGEGERIELSHKATDRSLFARGAVRAALWGYDKSPGLYSMNDVLGI